MARYTFDVGALSSPFSMPVYPGALAFSGLGDIASAVESGVVERGEAEAIYDQGREVVVAVLLRMDEQIRRFEERVARQDERIAELERKLNRSSRNSSAPPSSDPPRCSLREARIGRVASRAPRMVMRVTAGRFCRRGRSMRSSSTGQRAAAAAACSRGDEQAG